MFFKQKSNLMYYFSTGIQRKRVIQKLREGECFQNARLPASRSMSIYECRLTLFFLDVWIIVIPGT